MGVRCFSSRFGLQGFNKILEGALIPSVQRHQRLVRVNYLLPQLTFFGFPNLGNFRRRQIRRMPHGVLVSDDVEHVIEAHGI